MQRTPITPCQSLSEVRVQIDRIDGKLLNLLQERSAYVRQAAAFKQNPAEVAAPERVAQILCAIESRAQAQGLIPGLARAVWQTMIERFIAFEQTAYDAQKPPRPRKADMTPGNEATTPHPQQLSVAYLGIILIWSTTPLAIQWSAQGMSYAQAVLARMSIGLLLTALCVFLCRIPVPYHRRALQSYFLGGCSLFCAMALTYWGAQYLPSGLISVLYGLSPLATSLFARLWLPKQRLQARQIAGLGLALGGLCLIFLTGEKLANSTHLAGLLAILGAVLIQSANLVALKRLADNSPPMATTLGSLASAFPLFALLAWAQPQGEASQPDLRACLATAYLGIFGSVIGFALYYYAIRHMAPVRIALITLITPVVALCFGHWLNGEVIGTEVMLGSICILSGLLLHQFPLPLRKQALGST